MSCLKRSLYLLYTLCLCDLGRSQSIVPDPGVGAKYPGMVMCLHSTLKLDSPAFCITWYSKGGLPTVSVWV